MKTGLESLKIGAPKITYSGNEGPKPPQQMAMADPLLVEEYQKYVFEMEEQGLTPMSFEEFRLQAMSGMAKGGIAGSNAGSMLVTPTRDGSRPGYATADEGHENDPGHGSNAPGSDRGNGDGNRPNPQTMQDYLTGYATNVGKRADPRGGFFGDNTPEGKADNILTPSNLLKVLMTKITKTPPITLLNKIRDIKVTPTDDEDDDDNQGEGDYISPIVNMANIAVPTTPTVTNLDTTEDETKNFVNRFAPVTSFPFANYRGGIEVAAADGGRMGYAGGGITGLRQGYFLGKLVRKATKAVKKIAKSPVGKAALLAGGAGLLGGIGPFAGLRTSSFGKLLMGGKLGPGMMGPVRPGLFGKALNFAKANPFTTIAGLSTLPFLMPQEEEENLDAVAASRAGDVSPFDKFGGITGLRRKVLAGNLDPAEFPFMNPTYYAADGGRIGFANGGNDDDEDETVRAQALGALYSAERPKFSDGGAGLPPITAGIEGQVSQSFPDDETPAPTQPDQMPRPRPMMNPMMANRMNPMMSMQPRMMAQEGGIMMAAQGGRIGYATGRNEYLKRLEHLMFLGYDYDSAKEIAQDDDKYQIESSRGLGNAQGGRIGAQEGGLMDMGGMEKDYRNEGGFVPIGAKERADDVPARLSKNEFVFTAEAVRNAGGGDIDKGAEIMENMMENLEQGGKVSEESQGLKGARAMFATQQRLGEVL